MNVSGTTAFIDALLLLLLLLLLLFELKLGRIEIMGSSDTDDTGD
jgi:hypothetical protein